MDAVDSDERVTVAVVWLQSPMALASSGRPFAIGAPSVAVSYVQ